MPGEILTLRAFGDVIMVTTSERLVLAYSDAGVRLWQLRLDEIVAAPPVRVSDADVVLVDLAGEVRRLVIATGAVVWQHSLGSDVTVAPAVGAGVVVVMDRGQVTTGLDATTGQAEVDPGTGGQGRGLRRRHLGAAAGPDRARRGPGHRGAALAAPVLRHVHRAGDGR